MRRFVWASVFLVFSLTARAQEKEKKDPFDISETTKLAKELGVSTVSEVSMLEGRAKQLFETGDCKAAIEALDQFARKANWLANLIAAGIQPYYGASYDDRKNFSHSKLQALVPIENKANEYKEKRNRAMVMRAECLVKLGQKQEAVALLVGALNLISINDDEWWTRAKNQLFSLIEVR